jgi:hypothetical protein
VTSLSLRAFIGECFPTVAHLEAALWFRARPGLGLSVDEVAAALYLDAAPTRDRLRDLCRAGILAEARPDAFRWAPHDAEVAAALDETARAYESDLRGITSLIHDGATRRPG